MFKVRVLKNNFGCSKEAVYSFFMGVVLCEEIVSILKEESKTVVLGGREQIKRAMALILDKKSDKKVVELSPEAVDRSTSAGMVKIYEH